MNDREKVISEFERWCNEMDDECPVICLHALSMLKEHEAVAPIAKEDDTYECICGAIVGWDELDASGIVQTRFNYCPFCGKPVLWESR